jgi:hypothetical protein
MEFSDKKKVFGYCPSVCMSSAFHILYFFKTMDCTVTKAYYKCSSRVPIEVFLERFKIQDGRPDLPAIYVLHSRISSFY